MKRVLLAAVFAGALTLAVAAWIVEGAHWLLRAPARAAGALRHRTPSADAPEAPPVRPVAGR